MRIFKWFNKLNVSNRLEVGLFFAEYNNEGIDFNEIFNRAKNNKTIKIINSQSKVLELYRQGNFISSFGEKIILSVNKGSVNIKSVSKFFPFPVFDFGRNLKNIKQILTNQ